MQANYRKRREERIYRFYVTSTLKNMNKSVANTFTGKYMQVDYLDLIDPKPEETRTGEEIRQHIKDGLNKLGA